jgi:hypothetical protein
LEQLHIKKRRAESLALALAVLQAKKNRANRPGKGSRYRYGQLQKKQAVIFSEMASARA